VLIFYITGVKTEWHHMFIISDKNWWPRLQKSFFLTITACSYLDLVQPHQLFTEVPQFLGILCIVSLGGWLLLPAVTVVPPIMI